MKLPAALESLVTELQKLPTIGQKSAQRLAFHLMQKRDSEAIALARAIERVSRELRTCDRCHNLADAELCSICQDADRGRRSPETVCIVEQASDVLALERTAEFRGVYHVLEGALSPLKGVNPEDLRIDELLERVDHGPIAEAIIATNPNVEGEATAMYLVKLLGKRNIRTSRLAYGLPMGTQLEYTDAVTLARALAGRAFVGAGSPRDGETEA